MADTTVEFKFENNMWNAYSKDTGNKISGVESCQFEPNGKTNSPGFAVVRFRLKSGTLESDDI